MTLNQPIAPLRLLFVLLIALSALSVSGQSGRRAPRAPNAAPVPTPTPEPTPKPKVKEKIELGFQVGLDRGSVFSTYPLSFYDAVLQGCAKGLKNSSATVDVTDKNMTRGDAIKKAKAETTSYVVLLQLDAQTMSNNPNVSYDQLEVEYLVFAPVTAKVVANGRTYQNSNRKGPIVSGPTGRGPNSALYREQMLKRAAEEAGDRILKALHLSYPTTPVPTAFHSSVPPPRKAFQ